MQPRAEQCGPGSASSWAFGSTRQGRSKPPRKVWSGISRKSVNCGGAARAGAVQNCEPTGAPRCEDGGVTSTWPKNAGASSDWKAGRADTYGAAFGNAGTTGGDDCASCAGWGSRDACSRWPTVPKGRGIWPAPPVCTPRYATKPSADTASYCHQTWPLPCNRATLFNRRMRETHVRWCGRVPGHNPRHPTRSTLLLTVAGMSGVSGRGLRMLAARPYNDGR